MRISLQRMEQVFAICVALLSAPALGMLPAQEQPAEEEDFRLVEHHRPSLDTSGAKFPTALNGSRHHDAVPRARWFHSPDGRARLLPLVRAAEARHRLPAGLLDALIATESAYLPWAVSRAGAGGLAQLMPGTASDLGIVNRFDPLQSIDGGARYLRRMLDRFGSISLALAAYNAGPASVLKAGGVPYNGETADYVAHVLRRWAALSLD